MLFFGTRRSQRELPPERKVCPNCMSVTEHTVTDYDTRFTLYFIPLFSLKREVIYRCQRCGDYHAIPYDEYEAQHAAPEPEPESPRAPANAAPGKEAQRAKPQSPAEKARLILEGKVVNGKVENLRLPFQIKITSRHIVIALWVIFALTLLASAAFVVLLLSLMAQ
ncbi:MAG: zinc-ribbon domain-containing protein [Chloroflexota bacterium]